MNFWREEGAGGGAGEKWTERRREGQRKGLIYAPSIAHPEDEERAQREADVRKVRVRAERCSSQLTTQACRVCCRSCNTHSPKELPPSSIPRSQSGKRLHCHHLQGLHHQADETHKSFQSLCCINAHVCVVAVPRQCKCKPV